MVKGWSAEWQWGFCRRSRARPAWPAAPNRGGPRPTRGPVILAIGGGSYGVLYAVAAACALAAAAATIPLTGAR
jgi:hypothetical protein